MPIDSNHERPFSSPLDAFGRILHQSEVRWRPMAELNKAASTVPLLDDALRH